MRTIERVSVQRSCVRPWPAVIIATVLGGGALTGCEGPPDEEVTATPQPALALSPWSGWHQVPNGTFTESPAISSRGPGSLGLVGRGGDNRYWSASWLTSTGWSGFSPLANDTFLSKPAVTSFASFGGFVGGITGREPGNAVYLSLCTPSNCNAGFHPIPGGTFEGNPAIGFAAPYLYLFARKSDNVIYWNRNNIQNGYLVGNWDGWKPIPNGTLRSSPAVTTSGGIVYLVARGFDDLPWLTKLNVNNTWTSWSQVPLFPMVGDPAISQTGPDQLQIFGALSDSTIFVISRDDGAYTGRHRVRFAEDTNFKPTPAAWSWGPAHVDLVGFRQDNTYWINTYQE
jgi:hypothetical protein